MTGIVKTCCLLGVAVAVTCGGGESGDPAAVGGPTISVASQDEATPSAALVDRDPDRGATEQQSERRRPDLAVVRGGDVVRPMAQRALSRSGQAYPCRFLADDAGPSRIRRLREQAAEAGFDPDVGFGNLEVVAAREVGREPVVYVRNTFQYYLAYRLVEVQRQRTEEASSPW